MNREHRIKSRRRAATNAGLIAIVMASATACIFDQSSYKGGGRLDKGATAGTASVSEDASTDAPTTQAQDDAASTLDAFSGGD